MTDTTEALRASRRAHIEAALARYPHLREDEVRELTRYFLKEASALDVGLIASNAQIFAAYRRFRAEHVDRLRAQDVVRGLLFAIGVGAAIGGIIWQAMP